MSYRGQVQGDVVVLAPGVHLPDGMEVLIEPVRSPASVAAGSEFVLRNGVPIFAPNGRSLAPSLDLVNELRDEQP